MDCIQPCTAWVVPTLDENVPFIMDMMREAKDHLTVGWEGHLVDDLTDLSVWRRAAHIAAGILLLIPIINCVVFFILEDFSVRVPVAPAVVDDAFFITDIQVPPARAEEVARRKQEALAFLQRDWTDGQRYRDASDQYARDFRAWEEVPVGAPPQRPEPPRWPWKCTPAIRNFNISDILARYSTDHAPSALRRFSHVLSSQQRDDFRVCLGRYNGEDGPYRVARQSLSRLYDFLCQREDEHCGTDRENAFKGYVAGILLQILDAHRNCIDQINSQLETLLMNVLISWEVERNRGSVEDLLQKRTAYELLRYLLNLIKKACLVEYPHYVHMADLERHVKATLIRDNSGVISSGGIVHFNHGEAARIEQLVLHKEPAGNEHSLQDAQRQQHRRNCYYDPLTHLIEELRVYHGDMRVLRNKIMIWARAYYGLEVDDPLTQDFVAQISADPNLPADEGGDLTYGAIFCFLRQLGILEENRGDGAWRLEMFPRPRPRPQFVPTWMGGRW